MLIGLGKWFGRRASFLKLLLGGLLGAVIFYLVTNTLVVAARPRLRQNNCRLDSGADRRADWTVQPTTWELFRNTLLSGGLFTALFVAAEKLTAPAESPADKTAGAREPEKETEGEEAPEEAKA